MRAQDPHRARALRQTPAVGGQSAFTLIEIILAISIAVGLLIGAVWFYQQATEYRNQLLHQAEQLSAIRLVTDQLSGDLRAAHMDGRHAFTGDSNSVRFPRTIALAPSPGSRSAAAIPDSDLHLVSYRLISAMDGTNFVVRGITREDVPLIDTLAPSLSEGTGDWTGDLDSMPTNRVEEPAIDAIHHMAFRYWDGSAWVDSWNSFTPPPGVEVTLAIDPVPPEGLTPESGIEIFRRVIDVPAGMPAQRLKRASPAINNEPAEAP